MLFGLALTDASAHRGSLPAAGAGAAAGAAAAANAAGGAALAMPQKGDCGRGLAGGHAAVSARSRGHGRPQRRGLTSRPHRRRVAEQHYACMLTNSARRARPHEVMSAHMSAHIQTVYITVLHSYIHILLIVKAVGDFSIWIQYCCGVQFSIVPGYSLFFLKNMLFGSIRTLYSCM